MFRGLCPGKKCLELFMAARLASLHCVGCSATLTAEDRKKKSLEKKLQMMQLCSVFSAKSNCSCSTELAKECNY